MTELLNRTEVYCRRCQALHPARVVLKDGAVLGEVECPAQPWQTRLSAHGELFRQFRRQARFDPDLEVPEKRPFFFHYLSITDDCNCRCPVCYAGSERRAEGNVNLTLDQAREVARRAPQEGVRTVVLVGGEPTVHPQLTAIVEVLRQEGLKVWVATNGLNLARQPQLAGQLQASGVSKVCLQFDTFHPEIHFTLRGHRRIDEKLLAARRIVEAGMILGLVCTVTGDNLPQLANFCREVLAWPDPPRSIALQAAGHAGRLETGQENHVSREDIVAALVAGQALPGLTAGDFWPIPVLRPLDIYVHPDCAGNTAALVTTKGPRPIGRYLDGDKLLQLAAASSPRTSAWRRQASLALMAARSLRLRGWGLLLRHLLSRSLGRRGVNFVFIGTGAFLHPDFQDTGRLKRCASGALSPAGCESLCGFYSQERFALDDSDQ